MPSPLPPVVTGKRWMQLCIPDDPLWIAAYSGVLLQLTRGYWWKEGATKEDVIALANEAFASWLNQEGDCMDWCTVIADCINDPSSPANAAVRNIGGGSSPYPSNQPLPSDKLNQNQMAGYNPTCDQDITFGMCRYIVQTTNRLITDFLERFEASTNVIDILAVLSGLPFADELGLDVLANYTDYVLDVLAENYAAQYNQTIEDELACGLFCLSQESCSLTIEQIAEYFAGELGASMSGVDVFGDLITALLGAPIDNAFCVYSLFTLAWYGLKTGNIVLDGVGDTALQLAFKLGAGDPSDDWILLCDECNPDFLYWVYDGYPQKEQRQGTFDEEISIVAIPITSPGTGYHASIGLGSGSTWCASMYDITHVGYTAAPFCNAGTVNCAGTGIFCTYVTDPSAYDSNGSRRFLAFNSSTPFTLKLKISAVTE